MNNSDALSLKTLNSPTKIFGFSSHDIFPETGGFWILYVINAVGVSAAWFSIGKPKLKFFCQLLNISNFALVYGIMYLHSFGVGNLLKIVCVLLVITLVTDLAMAAVRTSYEAQSKLASDLVQALESAKHNEQLLQAFLDHFPGIAYAQGEDGNYIVRNYLAGEMRSTEIDSTAEVPRESTNKVSSPLLGIAHTASEEVVWIGGDARYFSFTTFSIRHGKRGVASCAVGIDLTAEKIHQKAQENAKIQMVAASKMSALGEMAGGIAHEINNPLAIISGRVEKLLLAFSDQSVNVDDAQKQLRKILTTVERIAIIVKALRTFARDGSREPQVATKLSDLVNETLLLCQERFRARGIAIRTSLPECEIDCRSVEISQVILNLLNNAYDAVEFQSEQWISIEARQDGERIEIAVTDSGPGIKTEILDKVLQPFFTTKPVGRGTGLGLSISSSIIQSHGGTLAIDAKSKNTRFVIRLPHKTQLAA